MVVDKAVFRIECLLSASFMSIWSSILAWACCDVRCDTPLHVRSKIVLWSCILQCKSRVAPCHVTVQVIMEWMHKVCHQFLMILDCRLTQLEVLNPSSIHVWCHHVWIMSKCAELIIQKQLLLLGVDLRAVGNDAIYGMLLLVVKLCHAIGI